MVKKLLQQCPRTGAIRARHHCSGRKPMILAIHQRQMRPLLSKQPDLSLEELRAALALNCSLPAIHCALQKMGLTYKERHCGRASRPPQHLAGVPGSGPSLDRFDRARLTLLDESVTKTKPHPSAGSCPHVKRRDPKRPHGHWQTTTMICAIRLDGCTACMTIEDATDTGVFRAYVQRVLCPILRQGDVVIKENSPRAKA
jgi:hypothetical protein